MKNRMKSNFKLSSNVLEDIHKYADNDDQNECPILFLKVKEVERDKGRYWLILEEENGNEIWAMFSVLLTQQILIQQLLVEPIIKIKHYYLHKFEAANFIKNPVETYINVIGINDVEIISEKTINKEAFKETALQSNGKNLQVTSRRKRKRKKREPELDTTDESDNDSKLEEEISKKKLKPKTRISYEVTKKKSVQSLENKNQNTDKSPTDDMNSTLKPQNIISKPSTSNGQASGNKSSDEKHNSSLTKSIIQPSENKNPNILTNSILPENFVGNGKKAVPISSLTLTKKSPLVRGSIKFFGSITVSARGCSYRRCRIKDSSGEMSCVIFEPICTNIDNYLRMGAIVEIEDSIVDELPASMFAGNEKYKLNWRSSTKIAIYHENTCVYEHPQKINPVVQSTINTHVKYKRLQEIKNSIRSVDRVDAIGVLVWMSQVIEMNSNNKRVKCRNIRIQDETTSVLVSLWDNIAETPTFPLGSIISAKYARLKLVHGDIEIVIDNKARISLAEDCEEKTRLLKWYQPAAKRLIQKI